MGISEKIKRSESPEIAICGGGHVGYELSRLCAFMGWKTVIIDTRPEYASCDRFPDSDVICGGYAEAIGGLANDDICIVIATPDHEYDSECLAAALCRKSAYIGMMGSRRKAEAALLEMRTLGFSEDTLKRVHTPIGVPIASETPKEIAVSITAELIKTLAEKRADYVISKEDERRLLSEHGRVVCARITEKRGSAPRDKGACIFVCESGSVIGTVGGGRWEADVIKDADRVLCGAVIKKKTYTSYTENAVCGGEIDVVFEVDEL